MKHSYFHTTTFFNHTNIKLLPDSYTPFTLKLIDKKAHWFLNNLRVIDMITVLVILTTVILSFMLRIHVFYGTFFLLFYGIIYTLIITTSKNYSVSGEVQFHLDHIIILRDNHLDKVQFSDTFRITLAYKSTDEKHTEWSFKQVATNLLQLTHKGGVSSCIFLIDKPKELTILNEELRKVTEKKTEVIFVNFAKVDLNEIPLT